MMKSPSKVKRIRHPNLPSLTVGLLTGFVPGCPGSSSA
jgi:hypothetical protein